MVSTFAFPALPASWADAAAQPLPHLQCAPFVPTKAGAVATHLVKTPSKRVICDKSVTTAQIEGALEKFILAQGHRDVRAIFADLPRNTKTAPRARLCARFAPLYSSMADFCKNAQLLPKRTLDGFININAKMRCNFTKMPDVQLLEDCEKGVRIGFIKYRMLLDSRQYAITMSDVFAARFIFLF